MVAALYETQFERVARYIAVRIGNVSEAEDLASEVFVRALRALDSYKDTGAPMEAWLFRIAHNIVVDHYRKQSRRPVSVPLDEALSLGRSHNLSQRLERHEEIQQLNRAMEQLSEAQRQVLALRFGGEMTSEQVGQVLGKKPGAVREMQSAAIRKLRQVLQRQED
jgi:RNA polymerase sigma-70 factor (ECF subfamily)